MDILVLILISTSFFIFGKSIIENSVLRFLAALMVSILVKTTVFADDITLSKSIAGTFAGGLGYSIVPTLIGLGLASIIHSIKK